MEAALDGAFDGAFDKSTSFEESGGMVDQLADASRPTRSSRGAPVLAERESAAASRVMAARSQRVGSRPSRSRKASTFTARAAST